MLSNWIFVVMIFMICYLLYITRNVETSIIDRSKDRVKKFIYRNNRRMD